MKDTAVAVPDVIDRNLFERYGDVQAFGANAAAWAPENWRNPLGVDPSADGNERLHDELRPLPPDAACGPAGPSAVGKSLANQTARATEDISSQINAMQSVTRDAVSAIRDIAQSIDKINHISTAITSAVEEQGAATKEIASSVQQAATGTIEVTRNVVSVSTAVSHMSEAAGEVFSATRLLSKSAGDIKAEIDEFLTKVRTA